MSKWLEQARSVSVPIEPKVPKPRAIDTSGTSGTFGTTGEDGAAFDERAAICEIDGELPASHAELVALACVAPLGPGETLESRDATIISLADYFDRLRARRGPR